MTSVATRLLLAPLALALAGGLSGPALAHHVVDGAMPTTALEGLLSGLGHPVIGPDHLTFLVGAGLVAALSGWGWRMAFAFIAGSLLGVLVRAAGWSLTAGEALVAMTLVAAGVGLAAGVDLARRRWLFGFALAGIVHGLAYGEAIVGADRGVLAAYLSGLGLVQAAIIAAVASVALGLGVGAGAAAATRTRAAGHALAAVGLGFLMLSLVPY
jgi:urease accessory protein